MTHERTGNGRGGALSVPRPARPRRFRRLPVAAAALSVLGALAILVATGVIWPGRIFAAPYEVRGVDVSSYQGGIDWELLAGDDLEFAYIKATEGSSSVDRRFAASWEGARRTDLLVGAYHFLSFESSGEAQARHVIETVPADATLPIAVDVEYYGDYFAHPPSRAEVDAILAPLLEELTAHYGAPPVIYATPAAYDAYIAGAYPDSPIWIRSVVVPPRLSDGRDWTFWQYSHRDRRPGYDGEEPYIDMNVYRGTRAQLTELTG
ncbi:GH25 family lysozyme [Brachybacterium hainanense]|uniref:GH25 family lysozyme n=1 Tax=Brachybacterium hainanense TaxID=1541174 RepID=A0ABV6RGB7_9MICO